MDGFAWNVLAIAATAVMFDIAARRSRATRALDVPKRTWLTGAAIVAVPWALILGVAATASTWLSWQRNPWYTRYDSFVVTYGDTPSPTPTANRTSSPTAARRHGRGR